MSMQLCIVTHVPLLGAKVHAGALQNIIHESYVILDGLINDFDYCLIDRSSTYNDITVYLCQHNYFSSLISTGSQVNFIFSNFGASS